MFSPSAKEGGPATATRSRRRQRPLSSENIAAQPKAKRQRLPLTEATFVNPGADANEQQQQHPAEPEEVPETTTRSKTRKSSSTKSRTEDIENHHTPRRELNIRAKKTKHGDRAANKGDGSLVLVRVLDSICERACADLF